MNNFPKLHNATWPGVVGKGPDSEPPIPFDTLLEMTAAAEVNGVKFDGVDIGLLDPHVNIDSSDDDIKRLADNVSSYGLHIGSLVAPIWGGPAMGSPAERAHFVEMVRKACHFGQQLRQLGVRPNGVIHLAHCPNLPRGLRRGRRLRRKISRRGRNLLGRDAQLAHHD
jgi:sugar phosphate isomerase/epimerase